MTDPDGTPPPRIAGYDLARGLAFLGMVVVNFKIVMGAEAREPAWLATLMDACTGRAAALFVILAGVGVSLLVRGRAGRPVRPTAWWLHALRTLGLIVLLADSVLLAGYYADQAGGGRVGTLTAASFDAYVEGLGTGPPGRLLTIGGGALGLLGLLLLLGRDRLAGPRGALFRRALFLAAVGYAWHPLWSGDILHFYALYLLFALAVVELPAVVIALLTAGVIAAGVGWQLTHDYWGLGWHLQTLEYGGFWTAAGAVRNLLWNGWHPAFPWLAFIGVGLLVGRLDPARRRTQLGLLAAGVALLWGTHAATPALQTRLEARAADALLTRCRHTPRPLPRGARVDVGPATAPAPAAPRGGPLAWLAGGAGARMPFDLDEALAGPEHRALRAAAQRLRDHLGRDNGRRPYDRYFLRAAPTDAGPALIYTVSYRPDRPAPADHREHLVTLPFIGVWIVVCWIGSIAFADYWRRFFRRGPIETLMRWLTG